jgi:hypothetical protein
MVDLLAISDRIIRDERLIELDPGFYVFPGSKIIASHQPKIRIAVHPDEYRYEGVELNPDYTENIDNLVAHNDIPLFVAIDGDTYDNSVKSIGWLKGLDATANAILYFTSYGKPTPLRQDWKSFLDGIQKLFSPDNVEVVGGEICHRSNGELSNCGCAYYTRLQLSTRFKADYNLPFCWAQPNAIDI